MKCQTDIVWLFTTTSVALLISCLLSSTFASDVCPTVASFEIVETLPSDIAARMTGPFPISHYIAWTRAVDVASDSIQIAALWVDLAHGGSSHLPVGGQYAVEFEKSLLSAAHRLNSVSESHGGAMGNSNHYNVSLVTNDCRNSFFPCNTTRTWLERGEPIDVTYANWPVFGQGWGMLHSKFLVADSSSYLGSANLAWSSLCQTREVGVMIWDCPALSLEISKQISAYVIAGQKQGFPTSFPSELHARFTSSSPARIMNGAATAYLTSSPPEIAVPLGFDDDLTSLVRVIDEADIAIDIELMDYSPASLYQHLCHHYHPEFYFDALDRALRRAAFRNVTIRLIVSNWKMTFSVERPYWASLDALDGISVRQFTTPAFPPYFPSMMDRVNHAKFMVAVSKGKAVSVFGTSNWSGDYFEYMAGASWIFTTTQQPFPQLFLDEMALFERDWNSEFVSAV